jgi:hypothetical protein
VEVYHEKLPSISLTYPHHPPLVVASGREIDELEDLRTESVRASHGKWRFRRSGEER